jgi:phage terminase small subunit
VKEQHRIFARNIAKGVPPMEAYVNAGFSAKSAKTLAYRLLDNVGVQAEIARIREKAESAAIASLVERREFLSRVIRGEEKEEHVTKAGEVVQAAPGLGARVKAVETMDKQESVYVTKTQDITELRNQLAQLRSLMSPGAYRELIQALASLSSNVSDDTSATIQ